MEGLTPTAENLEQFKTAIKAHIDSPTTLAYGTYLHSPGSTVYFNQTTNLVVVVTSNGEFLTGWKLDPLTRIKQYQNYIEKGVLR